MIKCVCVPMIIGILFSSGFYIAINILHLPNKVLLHRDHNLGPNLLQMIANYRLQYVIKQQYGELK